jgi:hypothetical protein
MSSVPQQDIGPLWQELHAILKRRHIHPGHDVVDSINRLLAKHPNVGGAGRNLIIPKGEVVLVEEQWPIEDLWALIHPSLVTSDEPASLNGAIGVLRWKGEHHLFDGRRRINHWHRNKVKGPHRVLVVRSRDDI